TDIDAFKFFDTQPTPQPEGENLRQVDGTAISVHMTRRKVSGRSRIKSVAVAIVPNASANQSAHGIAADFADQTPPQRPIGDQATRNVLRSNRYVVAHFRYESNPVRQFLW